MEAGRHRPGGHGHRFLFIAFFFFIGVFTGVGLHAIRLHRRRGHGAGDTGAVLAMGLSCASAPPAKAEVMERAASAVRVLRRVI